MHRHRMPLQVPESVLAALYVRNQPTRLTKRAIYDYLNRDLGVSCASGDSGASVMLYVNVRCTYPEEGPVDNVGPLDPKGHLNTEDARRHGWHPEVIEITAHFELRGDTTPVSQHAPVLEFHRYVKPSSHLNKRTTRMTGITNHHLVGAERLGTVLDHLNEFLRNECHDSGNADLFRDGRILVVACGEYALRAGLLDEVERKSLQLRLPRCLWYWCDLKRAVAQLSRHTDSVFLRSVQHLLEWSKFDEGSDERVDAIREVFATIHRVHKIGVTFVHPTYIEAIHAGLEARYHMQQRVQWQLAAAEKRAFYAGIAAHKQHVLRKKLTASATIHAVARFLLGVGVSVSVLAGVATWLFVHV